MTSFREVGENYDETKGAVTETIQYSHIDHHGRICADISSCTDFWRYPTYQELSYWQYDLNARRAGSAVANRLLGLPEMQSISYLWAAIVELVEVHALPDFDYVHVGGTDLLNLIRGRYELSQHTIITENCVEVGDGAQCVSVYDAMYISQLRGDFLIIRLNNFNLYKHLRLEHIPKLLVLGSCFSAPTDLTLSSITFTLVDQVCSERGVDFGGSVYIQLTSMPLRWKQNRTGVIKRIAGGIVTQRFKMHQYATKFPA